jgi:succinoglycan biosynthesis transport protein ExoP
LKNPLAQALAEDQPTGQSTEPESDFNIADYVAMVQRHWKLVIAACVATVSAGAIHYFITPKAYMATASIQIERRSLAPTLTSQAPWLESYFDAEYYPTQYRLLESRGLAERVVRRLDLGADTSFNPGHAANRPTTAEDDQAAVGALADRLRGGLSVEPERNTQLVDLTYRSNSPAFAARAANGFADAFIDMGIEYRFASAGKTSTFLGSQIDALKKEIDDREAKLQAFSRRTDIVTMEPGSNVAMQRLAALNSSYIQAKNQRIDKEASYRQLLASPKESAADTLQPGVVGSMRQELLKLEQDYDSKLKTYKPEWPAMVQLKGQIDKAKQHLGDVVNEMYENARKAAATAFETAQRQELALEDEIRKGRSVALDQNSKAAEYNNIQEELKTKRDLLDELMKKQAENEVQARLQDTRDTNVHVVDRATIPGGPFYPSLRKDVTYGMLFGLLLGVGAALLIEFLDRTIKGADEVNRRLGLPTLAVIQDITDAGRTYGYGRRYGYGYGYGEKSVKAVGDQGGRGGSAPPRQIELVPHEMPRTQISEAYRSLRTALLLSSAQQIKIVAITSSVAGEGKTATATNLAIVLAQLGRPVLIVDADLRKPRLHQVFRISNQTGIVSHLTATAESDRIIHPTMVPNLWVTPSGPIAPNPSELLSSDRFAEWLNMAKLRFEYVVIDTPPTLAVTDSTVVGTLADGIIITLRSGKVTREEAKLCRDRLRQAEVHILGAVLNRYRVGHSGQGRRYMSYESYVSAEAPLEPKTGSAA